jgi:hypothetical protein
VWVTTTIGVAIQTAVTPVDNILQAMAILVAKTIGVTKSCVENLVTKPFVDGTGLTILFKMKKRRMQLLQSPTTTPLIQIGMQTSEQLTTLPMTSSAWAYKNCYTGGDQVQAANGAGMSIAHVANSVIVVAACPIFPKKVLHVLTTPRLGVFWGFHSCKRGTLKMNYNSKNYMEFTAPELRCLTTYLAPP